VVFAKDISVDAFSLFFFTTTTTTAATTATTTKITQNSIDVLMKKVEATVVPSR
jgi:hypothetical protein